MTLLFYLQGPFIEILWQVSEYRMRSTAQRASYETSSLKCFKVVAAHTLIRWTVSGTLNIRKSPRMTCTKNICRSDRIVLMREMAYINWIESGQQHLWTNTPQDEKSQMKNMMPIVEKFAVALLIYLMVKV